MQKYVETLDMLKIKIATPTSNGNHAPLLQPTTPKQSQGPRNSNGHVSTPIQPHRSSNGSPSSLVEMQQSRHSFGISFTNSPKQQQQQPSRHSASGAAVVITTQWETFDSTPTPQTPMSSANPSTSATTNRPAQPHFTWDLL